MRIACRAAHLFAFATVHDILCIVRVVPKGNTRGLSTLNIYSHLRQTAYTAV